MPSDKKRLVLRRKLVPPPPKPKAIPSQGKARGLKTYRHHSGGVATDSQPMRLEPGEVAVILAPPSETPPLHTRPLMDPLGRPAPTVREDARARAARLVREQVAREQARASEPAPELVKVEKVQPTYKALFKFLWWEVLFPLVVVPSFIVAALIYWR